MLAGRQSTRKIVMRALKSPLLIAATLARAWAARHQRSTPHDLATVATKRSFDPRRSQAELRNEVIITFPKLRQPEPWLFRAIDAAPARWGAFADLPT